MKNVCVTALVAIAVLTACDDIFEKDISGLAVGVVGPGNDVQITEGEVAFAWHEVDGAQFYRLRIVSPSFETTGMVLADTLMCADSLRGKLNFRLALRPGTYQWSISASNFSSHGTQVIRTLHILSKDIPEADLSKSAVEVISPKNGAQLTAGPITFNWKEVSGATGYILHVVSPTIDNAMRIIADTVVYPDPLHGNPVCRLDIAAGQYQWGVRARNGRSQSAEAVQSFQVVPDIRNKDISGAGVVIVAPGAGTELTEGEVLFCWDKLDGATDYRLRVASPSFDNINRILVDTLIIAGTSSGSVTCKRGLPAGDYQWSVLPRNPSFHGQETVRSLKITPKQGTDRDITDMAVDIVAPVAGITITEGEVTFCWNEVEGAEDYQLRVVSPSFEQAAAVWADRIITAQQDGSLNFKVTLPAGDYQWSIRARNPSYKGRETVRSLKVVPKPEPEPEPVPVPTP